jgi:hypothetical protein
VKPARSLLLLAGVLGLSAGRAAAEPMFLSRQYARCSTCHYTATGGGLLTPYGRSLSREELSTTGRSGADPSAAAPGGHREEAFLWGALGDTLGPISLGLDVRPAHLEVHFPGGEMKRDFLMSTALQAAFRKDAWTVYAELGRQPRSGEPEYQSFEHWVGYESPHGLGVRVGRYLPAYGLNLADHTAFNRRPLDLDTDDQVYGVELSHTGDKHLLQVTASPGRAESIIHDDGNRAFTANARFQRDLGPRTALVLSGMYRGASDVEARRTSAGVAFGFAPVSHLSIWTEADAQFRADVSGAPAYVLINETAFEVVRGIWLKFTPQLLTSAGDTSAGTLRLGFELDLLPRTHWNLGLSYDHDDDRRSDHSSHTFLAQLLLYI